MIFNLTSSCAHDNVECECIMVHSRVKLEYFTNDLPF